VNDLHHIVIAVDGTPASAEAVRVGLEIAVGLGVEVTFVHGDAAVTRHLFDENRETVGTADRRLEADAVLRSAVDAAAARGVTAHIELIGDEAVHDLVPSILGIAAAVDASFVVVGSRGRGPLRAALLGSVSQGLLEAATVPVVVVHAPHESLE
jgi:nucleotide-binding universal stress UspA family protein